MRPLLVFDRDGIINKSIYRNKIFDSPMCIDEIEIFPWTNRCLKILKYCGFEFALATNQPAYAKGKISKDNLLLINSFILDEFSDISFTSINICFHKSEDNCDCRKPKTKMLEDAFSVSSFDKNNSWMIGDRETDIIAGKNFGIKTALLRHFIDYDNNQIIPDYYGTDLRDFTDFISNKLLSKNK